MVLLCLSAVTYPQLPHTFTNKAHIDNVFWTEGVAVGSDNTVFLANGDDGLRAYIYSGYVGIDDNFSSIASHYSLSQKYPNPFNPSIVIEFYLPKTSKVTLTIYNILKE